MSDETQSPFVSIQGIGQNLAGRNVQVVGWLIHKKEIGWPYEHPGNGDAGLFPTREHRYPLHHIVTAEEECPGQPTQALFRLVRCYAPQFLNDAVVGVERFYIILGEVCCSHIVTEYALPSFKGQTTRQHAQKGCLPSPIYPYYGNAISPLQYQVKILVYNMLPVRLGNVLEFDYDATAPRRLSKVEMYLLR
ncbi:unnamed protein product, partial [marine sediment metagenome]